ALAAFAALFALVMLLGKFIAGYAVLRMFPVFSEKTLRTMKQQVFKSALLGAAVLLISGPLAFVLIFSVVGLPLLLVLMILAAVGLLLAWVYSTYMVGRIILVRVGMKRSGRAAAFFVGVVLLGLLSWVLGIIPLLGWGIDFLITTFLTCWGLGAILLNKWGSKESKEESE